MKTSEAVKTERCYGADTGEVDWHVPKRRVTTRRLLLQREEWGSFSNVYSLAVEASATIVPAESEQNRCEKTGMVKVIRKWSLRTVVFIGCSLLLVVGCMSVAKVHQPLVDRHGNVDVRRPAESDWPDRAPPEVPQIEVSEGEGPEDCGAFGECRILRHLKADNLDGYLLITRFADPRIKLTGQYNFSSQGPVNSKYQLKLRNQTFVYCLVQAATRQPVTGTMFYLASIEGLSEREQKLLKKASDAGWNVIATTVEMSFSYPQQIVLGEGGEQILAMRIDNHLADRAYAVEAITKFLSANQPELLKRPRVMVGMSAGAIALPTVAARVGAPDAAVLIGGGQNVADIMLQSPLFKEHTTLVERNSTAADGEDQFQVVRDREKRHAFAQRAFDLCKLDPAQTATALSRTPVLMLHADYDKIVPAQAGNALYQSLEKPERWSYQTGHIGLCALLNWKAKPILNWCEENANIACN